ncbi:MAG: non-heme iron oxygenase ferredoxin subunit [Alicyclobacillaceae bacterium]|jgi:nitrite reductase/ring-hydroxylating ferredoxin subunit|uniref:non-heme iron oxygenase ferredoxin subunit n=1 Tax=Alicyclobacillus sp. SP_1 TaxID=2942475 RepID=UPI0021585282|nr:non-heme iron oxygenase ferredoxin subunit [Alicyclobacillus sp. SP_1]MCY0887534.1 non-heme iron oxygenase ferredoxin subunit [Alicyclobacillaceae bacterium]MCY0895105.1 non-heme iron oxygenase ferredoxin subunit [Alicyclobacillaceae bacterium]
MAMEKIAKLEDIPEGTMQHVEVGLEDVAIYHTSDGVYATSDVCTHASEQLSRGRLDGCIVACPKHGGKFDVRTGAAVAFPCVIPLQTFPVEIRDGMVYVDVD